MHLGAGEGERHLRGHRGWRGGFEALIHTGRCMGKGRAQGIWRDELSAEEPPLPHPV